MSGQLLQARLGLFAAALWWGAITGIGFVAVPLLFRWAPSPAVAGPVAARLFSAQAWLGVACGVLLLLLARARAQAHAQAAVAGQARPAGPPDALVFITLGLLLALLQEFAVAPRILMRQNLPLWHGLGTALVLGQWLCAALVLWRQAAAQALRPAPRPEAGSA